MGMMEAPPAGDAGSSSQPGSPPGSADAAPTAAELRNLPPDFWIYNYKIVPCENTQPHDWEDCLYSHKGEKAKRRDPSLYQALQCPEARTKRICPRGESCPCTHSLFEYWLHPDKFRTCMCEFGAECKRRVCFFAHNPSELRKPPNGDVVVDALAPQNTDAAPPALTKGGPGASSFRSSDSDDLSANGSMHDQQQQFGGRGSHGHRRSLSGQRHNSLHSVGSGGLMGGGGYLNPGGLNPNSGGYGPGSPMPPGLNGSLHHLGGMPPSVLEEDPSQLQHDLVGTLNPNSSYLAASGGGQQADLLWDSGSGVGGMALAEESYGPIGGYSDTWSPMDLTGTGANGRSNAGQTNQLSGSSHASTTSMSGLGLMCSPGNDSGLGSGATADGWGGFSAGALGGSSSATARRMANLGLPPRTASVPGVYHRASGGVAGVAGLSRSSSGAMGNGGAEAGLMDAQAQLLQLQELHRLRSHSFDVPASTGSMSQLQHLQAQLQQQQQQQQQQQMAHEPVAAQLAVLQQQQMRAHSFDTPYTLRSMQAQAQTAPVRQPTATVQSLAADIMSLDTSDRRALLQTLLQMQP